jgi:thermitase
MSRTKLLSNALVVQLFLSILFIGLAAAAPPQNIPGVGPKFVPEELIVKFKAGVSDREINAINVNYGTSVRSKNRIAHFMRLQIHGSDRAVQKLVKKYRENKKVEYAEPNYIRTIH